MADREHNQRYGAGTAPVIIDAARRRRLFNAAEIWQFRELLFAFVERNIRVRYKQTLLGVGWALLQPLLMMAVFSVLFGRLARLPSEGIPYPSYVLTALVPWTFFSGVLTHGAGSVVTSSSMVRKVYFPRAILPLASAGVALVDFGVAACLLLAVLAWYGHVPGPAVLLLPILVAIMFCAALGAGMLLAALTVYFRDFRYVVPFLVQVWLFATPVIYPARLVPPEWRWLLFLNPMSGVVSGFRGAFLGLPVDSVMLVISGASALVLLIAGLAVFGALEQRFADVI